MLGSAVSSSTPTDFQPRLTMGWSEVPLMNRQAPAPGPTLGCPYCAVGMHRALESPIGLPSISTNASRMLGLVTPPDVRRSFTMPPETSAVDQQGAQAPDHHETHGCWTRPTYPQPAARSAGRGRAHGAPHAGLRSARSAR